LRQDDYDGARDASVGESPSSEGTPDDQVSRLSQAIAEGNGISILVEVSDAEAAVAAERQGADVLVVRDGSRSIRDASPLPLLHLGGTDAASTVAADAVVIAPEIAAWDDGRARELECVVRIRHADELEWALEELDPEIFLLVADSAPEDDPLELLLALLHDVPAGKLAVAELRDASAEEVAELERAGVDGVLVASSDVAALVGTEPPDV
jgi:indole-3-glycerol phosphate synthase